MLVPWFAGSHRAWAEGLARHSEHDVHLLTLPGSFWRWRQRGAAVTLAAAAEAHVAAHGQPDVVVATGFINLAAFLGLSRRWLGDAPVVAYLHENQIVYPDLVGTTREAEPALVDWTNLVAADHVWCNSAFHRDALASALPAFLAATPDPPHVDRLPGVLEKLSVQSVGVELSDIAVPARGARATGAPLVVWNQRWDYDKNPERFLANLVRLADDGVDFTVALAGANRRVDPREFASAIDRLGDRVTHVGVLDRADYVELLARGDVVVSTARHEFFGIALLEAVAAGAVPLLPDRMSYPEVIPPTFHPPVLFGPNELYGRFRAVLTDLDSARRRVEGLAASIRRFGWTEVAPRYDAALSAVAEGGPRVSP